MATQKIYSESNQIGEEGQKLAALVIIRLGHVWRDHRIDHGRDRQKTVDLVWS